MQSTINRPCGEKVLCGDPPLLNLSAESPDPIQYIGIAWRPKGYCVDFGSFEFQPYGTIPEVCLAETQEEADRCAKEQARHACLTDPPSVDVGKLDINGFGGGGAGAPGDPPPPGLEPDDPITGGVGFIGCNIGCSGWRRFRNPSSRVENVFWNTPQSCTLGCKSGVTATYKARGGLFPGRTQEEADFWANVWACHVVSAQLLRDFPGCVLVKPPIPFRPYFPVFWNFPQVCSSFCTDGSQYFYTAPEALFVDYSQARADARAKSFACRQASLGKVCFTFRPILSKICHGGTYHDQIAVGGGIPPLTFAIIGGSLPDGISMSPTGELSGTAEGGGNSTFTVQVTDSRGNVGTHNYTIGVLQITNDADLPSVDPGTEYSVQLDAIGGLGPYTFVLIGELPPGLTLSATGLISGTSTCILGTVYDFSVGFTDRNGPGCLKEFHLVCGDCPDQPAFANTQTYRNVCEGTGGAPDPEANLPLITDQDPPDEFGLSYNGTFVVKGIAYTQPGQYESIISQAIAQQYAKNAAGDRMARAFIDGDVTSCGGGTPACDPNTVDDPNNLTWLRSCPPPENQERISGTNTIATNGSCSVAFGNPGVAAIGGSHPPGLWPSFCQLMEGILTIGVASTVTPGNLGWVIQWYVDGEAAGSHTYLEGATLQIPTSPGHAYSIVVNLGEDPALIDVTFA